MLVTMSVDIEAPPEVVWSYLVEPEKTKAWFTALKTYDFDPADVEAGGFRVMIHSYEVG